MNLFKSTRLRKNLEKSIDKSKKPYSLVESNKKPEPVQNYLKKVLPEEGNLVSSTRLKHRGQFKPDLNSDWMDIKGKEIFNSREPGFIWVGKVKPKPYLLIKARDSYVEGEAEMSIKLFSLIPIRNERNNKLNQADLARWLLESPWFPTALLLDEYLEWEPVNSKKARVKLDYANQSVEAILEFNEDDLLKRATAKRYWRGEEGYRLVKWGGEYSNYKKQGEYKIPKNVLVSWFFEDQKFEYAKFDLTEIKHN